MLVSVLTSGMKIVIREIGSSARISGPLLRGAGDDCVVTMKNIGILITDHNVQETLAITDRTYLMFEGSILKAGSPDVLANNEMVRKVYLGQNFELRKKKLEF